MSQEKEESSPISAHLSLVLNYQKVIIQEIYKEDGLVIIARGLGLLNIVANFLHTCNLPKTLTLVIGASGEQEEFLKEIVDESGALDKEVLRKEFKIINNESGSPDKREAMYDSGGIFSVTSRILVVDLLTGILDPSKITGIIALNAEKANETSLEAFILRIFRKRNKIGYIKAFSDNPEAFSTGFSTLSDIMKSFFLKKCFLWPRFHVLVAESLESKKVDVIELEVPMTEAMKNIQQAIFECMEICISELKSANSDKIDIEDWNVDNALHKSFDRVIRRQLDLYWHRISRKTKQLVSDLTTLRRMLYYLLSYDCVSFYKILEIILIAESSLEDMKQERSPWLLLDSANIIFKLAKERVYKRGTSKNTYAQESYSSILPVLENQPKWFVLKQIMHEIEMEINLNPELHKNNNCSVLIMCKSEYTCSQIQEYLKDFDSSNVFPDGNDDSDKTHCPFLKSRFKDYLIWKQNLSNVKFDFNNNSDEYISTTSNDRNCRSRHSHQFVSKRRRMRGGSYTSSNTSINYAYISLKDDFNHNEVINTLTISQNETISSDNYSFDDEDNCFEILDLNDLVVISPYNDDMDDILFKELKPRFIILYEPNAVIIRRIELYHSIYKNELLRVYFMYYGNSVEEQKYLATVRREKDSFAKLVKEKGNMAILLTEDKSNTNPESLLSKPVNLKIEGGVKSMANTESSRIIVDIREFRNPLPSLLYNYHVNVIPCQLTVGDYILSSSLCVERKTIRDLISSLNNGRLYHQCEMMQLYYSTFILLIEFSQNKSFNLNNANDLSSNINVNTLQSKLVLLTIAFPNLKIIWSSSSYATCEIFLELKKNRDEPDLAKAISLGLKDGEDNAISNQGPQDFLLSIPKITLKNYKNIIYNVDNICDLSNLEEKQIIDLIGQESGKAVYSFFNKTIF
ncbi:hypothetical protein T552_02406 [Pneumocystis carinii B80]|uniref:ERCC4 domain-containing protein n=1 Tax=Pneumocystis carinii (strain B80) TaxID=1408658 RepID=A0A0W4ZGE6_PNEC8|nr:hypothetical protein T552_02406 [Pneumocystis carinii B80]KTW27428.1 hypothetical protein T552_02406 [Pneumocystis carinii B80]